MSTEIEDSYYDDAELDDFIVEDPVPKSTAPTSDQESEQNDPIETSERIIVNSKPNLTQTQKLLKAHISVLVSTLGGPDHTADSSTRNYKLGHDALACLKDIKRWIKAYDERNNSFDVGLACAESGLVSNDLVVILCQWEMQCQKKETIKNVRTTEKIMLACLELLVLLTWPFEITPQSSENQKLLFSDIRKSQIAYKHSILSYHKGLTLKAVIRLALPSIAKAKQEREPRDNAILRLVIFFLRNILYIEPANSSISSKSTKQVIDVDTMPANITYDDISINTVLDVYKRNKALMLLLTVSGSVGSEFDRDMFGPTCLECIFLLTKGTKVEDVFKAAIPRQQPSLSNGNAAQPLQTITTTSGMQLQDLLSDETKRKKAQTQNLQTRHGRFGSLLSIRTNDANSYVISGQEALHNTDSSLDKLDKTKKWNRRKLVKYDSDEFTNITNPVYLNHIGREILYEFVQQVLNGGCFNNLIESVGSIFSGMSDLVSIDEYEKATFYLTCAWFLNYKRERNAWYAADPARMQSLKPDDDPVDFGSVGAALSEITFILIITYFRDSFTTKRWSSLHAAMICFKELLHISQSLFGVTKHSDQHNIDRELAEGIIRKFFSFSDFINIIVQIPQTASKHSPEYLSVTISIVHIILKSFESFANEDVKLYVQTKRKQAKQNKKRVNDLDKHTEDAMRAMIENEDSDFEDFEDRMKEIKRERRLDFKATEIRFFQSSIVSTYIEYLSRYEDLTHDEIKRCLSYFHRLFVVLKDFTGLYRLDFMHLLQKLRNYLPRGSSIRKHVDEFIYYFMKKFKVAFTRFPMPIEVLFPRFEDPESKTYLAIGELYTKPETTKSSSRLKMASPLEFVRDNFSLDEKFKILISALYLEEKEGFLFWLKHQLSIIIELRVLDPNHKAILESTPTYRRALIQSGTIRLLLSTMGFELPFIVEEDCELPPGVTNEELNEYLQLINKWVSLQPATFEDDKDPSYFLRIKESFDENYGDEDIDYKGYDEDDDSIAFVTEPTNGTRNNLNELDTLDALERELEGVKGKARKKGIVRQEKKSKSKKHSQPKGTRRPPRSFSVTSDDEAPVRSAEYVGDSDDESDDEKAQEFFNREERLRQLISTSGGIVNPGQLKEFKKAWAKLEKSRGGDTAESVKIALQETSFEKISKEAEQEKEASQDYNEESDEERESDEEVNDSDALSTTESMEDLKRKNDSDDEDKVVKKRKRRVILSDDED